MNEVRSDSPDAREFIKASGLLYLLRFGRFPKAPDNEETEQKTGPAYTKDMSVEDICAVMTLDEALNYVVTSGACAGQKLSQVAERRAASLRFYLTGYKGDDNILRAAATLIIASRPELQAS